MVNRGASQYHVSGHIEEHTICELALCDMSETIGDVTPYIRIIKGTVISIYRLCTSFPKECNRIEPIIWAFSFFRIAHLEIQARKSSYYVFVFDQRMDFL